MKLIFVVLDVSLTMGLTHRHKTEGFFYIYLFCRTFLLLCADCDVRSSVVCCKWLCILWQTINMEQNVIN